MSDAIDLKQVVPAADTVRLYRRIITGHNSAGRSIIVEDAACPNVQTIMGVPEFATTEFWKTVETPVDLTKEQADPAAGPVTLPPPVNGTVLRVVEFPPDSLVRDKMPQSPPKDLMHRTASIDYAFVIEGEVFAILDEEETLMKAGDFMIQRGTNHNWSNRSSAPARVLFVLIGATLPT